MITGVIGLEKTMNAQEEEVGHVYLKTNRPIAEVGKRIAEEFSNWRYDDGENLIYQKEEGKKLTIWMKILLLLLGIVLTFIYPPIGIGFLSGFVVGMVLWVRPKDIEKQVDYITFYELTESSTAEDPHPTTHVDFKLFDDDGNINITEGDIMNIRERL